MLVGAVAAFALLIGCAGVRTVDNGGYKRVAQSLRFEFSQQQGGLPIKITREGYGFRPTINQKDIEHSQREVGELIRETRTQTLAAVQAAMREKNIPPGDDLTVFVDFKEAVHRGQAGITLTVWTHFKDAPPDARRWIFNVEAHGPYSKPADTATKAAEAIVRTLVQEGVLVSR
jgi:hypothetical protein